MTLRQIRPAAATGSLLVCLYVLSDFGAVSILRFDSFTRVIYQSYQSSFDRRPAAILGCLLLVFTLGILVAEARTRGRARYYGGSRGAQRRPAVVPLGRWRWVALALPVAVAALALAVPLGTTLRWLAESVQAEVDLGRVGRAAVVHGAPPRLWAPSSPPWPPCPSGCSPPVPAAGWPASSSAPRSSATPCPGSSSPCRWCSSPCGS